MANRKLKILCLHGYRQSKDAFRAKTGSFRKGVKKFAEFVMFDAPHLIDPDAIKDDDNAGERGWYFCHDHHYHSTEETSSYVGLQESIARVQEVIAEQGPFDGMLAFSQGAQFLAILCAQAQLARARGEVPAIDPKFAIFISGEATMLPIDAQNANTDHEELFGPTSMGGQSGDASAEGEQAGPPLVVHVPTMHIMGTTDQVIPVALSQELATTHFAEPVQVVHEGGHFVPWPKANTPQRDAILRFFAQRVAALDALA
ncbi:hypothetical protein PTSG_07719 [Salpingoeca rosetta]|uniref:Serine hydrolase domain-containing protein n=1 Tax=Salpingoeca rosetta (strain ATCC 50818 / BSB-021) TaxID=946362 RepID=F2UHK3_SALR5|nr:uncharacterized protein PTSG_07719 [Salpingoeca rosetta]EGD76602.1 hypothetical protein PTSG_07719 [Salpingoeca rosetta]|eukprot:XP_004991516.1 hypothetical protein PTSG_07719 [Salpingoeca rosetta]